MKTWVVECYVPGVDDAAVRRAADHAATATRAIGGLEAGIEYLGALVMAVDEVVLHTFRAEHVDVVSRAAVAARLPFERVIESVEILPEGLIAPTTGAVADSRENASAPLFQPGQAPS